jgi:hypothetical protein
MPTKHIDDATWRKVEVETVRAVIATKTSLKDTEVLKLLILKGIQAITENDYEEYVKKKKGR